MSLSEHAARYRQEVEKVVREIGEHPLYELKRSCALSYLADKVEFVKDVQSICTSKIEFEKFLVIGADQKTKTFVSVDNSEEFDEAKVRAQLEKYLHPVPEFQVFPLESSDGKTFILLVFPRQRSRRIVAKVSVDHPSEKAPKILLRKGDVWTKGGSTAKRLAGAEDWDEIYEEVIEIETERRTRQRTAHDIERVTAQEKLRAQHGLASLPSFGTDEDYKALMESLCISKDQGRFLLLLERLRDDLIEDWHSIDAFGPSDDLVPGQTSVQDNVAKVSDHKRNIFLPAMQKLTSAAIYTVKNGGPAEFLTMTVEVLEEVYDTTNRLRSSYLLWLHPRGLMPTSSTEHVSHTVPAFESLISLHLIGAYIVKRKRFEYLPNILRLIVREAGREETPDYSQPLTFWPLRGGWGEPAALRQVDGRIKLWAERVQKDPVFLKLFGSEASAIAALCQYELLLELNSYLAVDEKRTPASVAYMKKVYPNIRFEFYPSLIAFPFEHVTELALKLLREIKRGNKDFFKPLMFDESLAASLANGGEGIFAMCLDQLAGAKRQLARQLGKFFWDLEIAWPNEIAEAIQRATAPQAVGPRV